MIIGNEVIEARKARLEAELARAIEALKELGAVRIVLIGSMARNAWSPFSDIDLVVVLPTQERFLDRLKTVYGAIQPTVAMDILVYTPEEFEEMSRTNPFLLHALRESRILHAA
jgi:predicted nucleotidyltransferase